MLMLGHCVRATVLQIHWLKDTNFVVILVCRKNQMIEHQRMNLWYIIFSTIFIYLFIILFKFLNRFTCLFLCLEIQSHPFISMYDNLAVDLASYFTEAGSPLATF